MQTVISGAGCSLLDYLFTGIDFSSPVFQRYRSRTPGDGGLEPGTLVFASALEEFAGVSYHTVLEELSGGRPAASSNLGGPSVVALVRAAQLLHPDGHGAEYHGVRGDDEAGQTIAKILAQTPLNASGYAVEPGVTPFTHALSDPSWSNGAGERSFVNATGVAAQYRAADLPTDFYHHPIVALGGTALVPAFHAELDIPLRAAHRAGALTFVNTVYDFFNESRNPDRPWPIGDSAESYRHTDILVVDAEEARRLSGAADPERAAHTFVRAGVSAVVITAGTDPVLAVTQGGRFRPMPPTHFPVSARVGAELAAGAGAHGDTTGCGDNFAGGLLYALALQMIAGEPTLDLRHALEWAVCSGGVACFSLGGTYLEQAPGELRTTLREYVRDYNRQLGGAGEA